jgi:3-dehydroquinate synthase
LRLDIQVRHTYPVHFIHAVFDPGNALLAEVLSENASRLPVETIFVLDGGLVEANPRLVIAIESYCEQHSDRIRLCLPPVLVPGGERAKTDAALVQRLYQAINEAELCRHSQVVAVGGGAVLDLVGFATATAHRGVRLTRLPTTVLAQNDSGVGVKNGVNAFGKKNWVGTFAPPHAVVNDLDLLRTLPERDWRAGISEAVKVALIRDAAFFDQLEDRMRAIVGRDEEAMAELIHRCAALHLDHIGTGGDPFESGSKRPLDFGHWAAHKLEQLTHHRLRHGEAVAIGIALDTTYSYLAGYLDEAPWERIVRLLQGAGFELCVPEMIRQVDQLSSPRYMLEGLDEFRQHLGGRLTITLLRGIGDGFEVHELDERLIRGAVALLHDLGRESRLLAADH